MVAIPKSFPFMYEDEPPMGPLGHEDVDTAAQSVDGKLLIIIRALDFLAKQNKLDSHHKVTGFVWDFPTKLKTKFERSITKSISTLTWNHSNLMSPTIKLWKGR
jgi:hypothetical protein